MTRAIRKPLNGLRFGRLTVVDVVARGPVRYRVQCDCGTEKYVVQQSLVEGKTNSCGCLQREDIGRRAKTHGHTVGRAFSPTYQAWASMVSRCHNSSHPRYEDYGGRGIKVCKRWRQSFEAFLEDMGERPSGLTVDRIDNDKGYSKANCHWATRSEQALNKRNTLFIEPWGIRVSLTKVARASGLRPLTVRYRVLNGWTPEQAILKGARYG